MFQLLLKEEPLSLNNAEKGRKDEYRKKLHALIDARYDLEGKKSSFRQKPSLLSACGLLF